MKHILTALLLLTTTSGWSQNRFSITAVAGVDYTNSKTKIKDPYSMTDISKATIAYRAGLDFGFQLTKHFSLKTGFRYLNTGIGVKDVPAGMFTYVEDPATGQLITPKDPNDVIKQKIRFRYLEIPLGLRYQFGKKNLSWFVEGGVIANIYMSNRQQLKIGDFSSHYSSDDSSFNKVLLSPYIAVGAQYRLAKHLQVYLQPTFRYCITPAIDGPVKTYLYSAGAEFGLRYLLP